MLIKCPECNGTVSDSAKICPHCGFGIEEWKWMMPDVDDRDRDW